MEIIIEVGEIDSQDAVNDLKMYVDAIQREIDRRQWQDMPGAWLTYGNGGVWAKSVRLSA